jgi:hypothetical protein
MMKKSRQCPKCSSLKIGYVPAMPDRDGDELSVGRYDATPDSNFRCTWVHHPVEGFLCADCGCVETYVKAPGSVAYDKIPGFRWVNADPAEEGPYR